jgi:hypothetical protein
MSGGQRCTNLCFRPIPEQLAAIELLAHPSRSSTAASKHDVGNSFGLALVAFGG